MEVDLIDHCTSQQFPHVVEEYLNMYTCSGFSLNPLTLGLDSLHCCQYTEKLTRCSESDVGVTKSEME